MPWFRKRSSDDPAPTPVHDDHQPQTDRKISRGGTVHMPAHLQHIISERERAFDPAGSVPPDRRAVLERKRLAIQFDIDQGELASEPDNPWIERIELLSEALEAVERELQEAERIAPGPYAPVPESPISDIVTTQENGVALTFTIGDQRFAFAEDVDWAERGFQIAEPVLRQTAGDAAQLVPGSTPDNVRDALTAHLVDGVMTFATDIRNRVVDGDPIPADVTLASLASPCPVCGGWTDHLGTCRWCAARRATAQALFQERTRLITDRTNEAEERHRIADRLALARARMANLEREIAALD